MRGGGICSEFCGGREEGETVRAGPGLYLGILLAARAVAGDNAIPTVADIRAAGAYSVGQRGTCLLVIQGGKTIWEEYTGGSSETETNKIYSGTKAFWNLAALAAEEDGLLTLNEAAADTVTEWRGDDQRARITIRQLLDFSSGLDPTFYLHREGLKDRDTTAIGRALVAGPGREFIYGPCSLQVFHAILKRKLAARGETPTRYLERRVLVPLGLGPQRYLPDGAGNPLLASGFMLSARQWAELGKLLLRGGEPVLHQAALKDRFRGSRANRAFGLGLWNNGSVGGLGSLFKGSVDIEEMLEADWKKQRWDGVFLCRSAPPDLFASIGSAGQRLYVVPSLDLVVVRMGKGAKFSDPEFLKRLFPGR